ALVLPQLPDAAHVALITRKRGGNKQINKADRISQLMLTCTDGNHVRIVVLTRQLRGRLIPDQCSPDSLDLVRGHLLAVPRAAEHDAKRLDASALIACHAKRSVDAERRVVVERVVLLRAVVDDLVALTAQVLLQLLAE